MNKHTLFLTDTEEVVYYVTQLPPDVTILTDNLMVYGDLIRERDEHVLHLVAHMPKRRRRKVIRISTNTARADISINERKAYPHSKLFVTRRDFLSWVKRYANPHVIYIITDTEILSAIGRLRNDIYYTANPDCVLGIPVLCDCTGVSTERMVYCIAEK